jgi:hypothetical protein
MEKKWREAEKEAESAKTAAVVIGLYFYLM